MIRQRAAAAIGLSLAMMFMGGAIFVQADSEDDEVGVCAGDSTGVCEIEQTSRSAKRHITCDGLSDNQIDWECVFGPGALKEVHQRGGHFTTCPKASKSEPCSRFIVAKSKERSEVKVKDGPDGFPFLKGERYVFRYSFRPKEGMRVAKKFTHLGQLKGSVGGNMIKGDPIYSLTANNDGLMVRFSNKESIEDYHPGMKMHLDWDKATGEWVHVKITTVFGKSMEVEISGPVKGKAVWPKNLKPVAWHRDAEMVRMKLGLYHSANNVADGEVEYKNISIEGPNGTIRSGGKKSRTTANKGEPGGYLYRGCFRDAKSDRVFNSRSSSASMTTQKCQKHCKGSEYFATQYGRECWCGDANTDFDKHGDGECTKPCAGGVGEMCGGYNALSVYEDGGVPDDVPRGAKYLGCYADENGNRALTLGGTVSSRDMTYKRCFDFCSKKKSATYMALEYGKECFCGSSKDDYDMHGEAICGVPCTGDGDSVCGGRDAMGVFKI